MRAAGYGEESVVELLGEDGPAPTRPTWRCTQRRLADSPLATCMRLCCSSSRSTSAPATAASGPEGVDALLALGPRRRRRHVLGRGPDRSRRGPPHGFDGFARGVDDPLGFVAPYTPTASWLAALTPRRRVARALDVGTGNGVHALLAAAHSDHVIATDVNPRALAFTEINAALNGLDNIETRLGSLFEPVAGEHST